MAGTTTYYGISYPTSTDYVKDGATAMQTIATGFDSAVAIPTYNNQTGTTYTFVLADTGKTVTASNASASTYTIPPQSSVAWASGATLTVRNLGAGVVTFAGGSGVTVTNTAATLAQYTSAKLIRTASDAWTVVPEGSASGLTLISAPTVSAQSTWQINNLFTSTYTNYKVIYNITITNATNLWAQFSTSGTPYSSTGYAWRSTEFTTVSSYNSNGGNAVSKIELTFQASGGADRLAGNWDIISPQLSAPTYLQGFQSRLGAPSAVSGAVLNINNQFDGLYFYVGAGTMTGQIWVYGYKAS